jgi:hypothetical protein
MAAAKRVAEATCATMGEPRPSGQIAAKKSSREMGR